MSELSLDIQKKADYWASSTAFDAKTKAEIKALIESQDSDALADRFYKNLSFGTGGMRGVMGAGTAFMNSYNIKKATASLALYLKETFPGKALSVALAFDSRTHSKTYAKTAASVLAAYGLKAYLCEQMRPVPTEWLLHTT